MTRLNVLCCSALLFAFGCLGTGHPGDSYDLRGPIFITEPPERVDFSNSTGVTLECSAHGYPSPVIRWTNAADASVVDDVAPIRQLHSNGSLFFPPFRAELYRQDIHAAKYYCLASSPLGTIRSRTVYVRAVVQQYYEVQVYDEFVIVGNTAVLKCHIPPFVREHVHVTSWIRNQNIHIHPSVNTGSRFAMLATGELYVFNTTNEDSADIYKCQTVNRLTQEVKFSAPGRIIVSDPKSSIPPRIIHSFITVSVAKGKNAKLPCVAQGLPLPTHTWYRLENQQTQMITETSRVRTILGMLIILEARMEDSGTYVCKVANLLGGESHETILSVTENLAVYVEPQEVTADVGQSVSFTCVITGSPVTSVEWLKDGEILQQKSIKISDTRYEMIIEWVDGTKRGMYQCMVSNEESSAQGTAELRLGAITPGIIGKFPESPQKPGSVVVLQCVISGSPVPIAKWYLDGEPLPMKNSIRVSEEMDSEGNYVSSVTFMPVEVQDSGYYQCIAKNNVGEVKYSDRLNVYGALSIRKMGDIAAVGGTDILIICPVSGYPLASISWIKDGNVLPANQQQQVFLNGSLWIQQVRKSIDEGLYTCIVKDDQGQVVQQSRNVRITVPPVIETLSFPGRHVVHVGTRTRLQCVITEGDLPLTIRWLKDGRPFSKNMPVTIRKEDDYASVLAITNISSIHQGMYTCIATNKAASVNITTQIVVEEPPRWVVQPMDTSVVFQGEATLGCSADGSPTPTVTWKKSSGRFPGSFMDLTVMSPRISQLPNGSLYIKQATEDEEGQFLCEINNGVGFSLSKIVKLNVEVPARIEIKQQNKTAKRGDNAQLECTTKGETPLSVSWLKDDVPIKHAENERIIRNDYNLQEGKMSEIIIYRADRQDVGKYTCIASNIFGKDESQIYFYLKEPPEPPDNIRVVDHTSKRVRLSWSSDSNSNIITRYVVQYKLSSEEWEHKANNISVSGNKNDALIDGLESGKSYSFRVLAENDLGFGHPSNGIVITTDEEVPAGPPHNVRVEPAGSQSLLVRWTAPYAAEINGELQGYHVGYKACNAFGPYTYKTVETNKENGEEKLVLSSLLKYTNYSIVVQAFNRAGAGPASASVIALTDEDVPSEAPQNIQCRGVSSQQLQISWEAPPPHTHNGIIIGYKLMYAVQLDDEVDEDTYEMKTIYTTAFLLHELEKWRNYSVTVLAFTKVGDGKRSLAIACETMEDVPAAPADVKALTISSKSILLSWKMPLHPNGIVKKFTIYMRMVNVNVQQTTKFSVTSLNAMYYELKDLKEESRYDFWITATTSIGEGESTKIVTQTTASQAPARIATFWEHITETINKTVNLPCLLVGTPATTAIWSFSEIQLQENTLQFPLVDHSFRLFKVQRNNSGNYTCFVKNKVGSDNVTHVLHVIASPDPPNLQISMTTSTTVILCWKVHDDGGAPIKGYTLHYKREFDEWETVHIHRHKTNHSLLHLRCGTEYSFFITAYNKIGISKRSQQVITYTNGTAPSMPTLIDVMRTNTTSVELNVANWPDNGCPIRYFVVQYLNPDDQEWVLVSNSLQPQHEVIVISDLKPSAFYKISVTAHNDAGTTVAHYEVMTLPLQGSVEHGNSILLTDENPYFSLYFSVPIIIVVLSCLIIIIITVSAIIKNRSFLNCTNRTERIETSNTKPNYVDESSDHFTKPNCTAENQDVMVPYFVENVPNAGIIYDDVCPYATSNIAELQFKIGKTTQIPLQTFVSPNEDQEISQLYSKMKFIPQQSNKDMLYLQQKVPSMEDLYSLYQLGSGHYIHRHTLQPLGKNDNFSSDWNLKEKESIPISCDNQERSQVPDLLYHGTDSSSATPNDSSPEDNCVWSASLKRHIKWSKMKPPNSLPSNYAFRHAVQPCSLGYPNCHCQLNDRPSHKTFYPCASKEISNNDGTIRV